MPVGTVASVRGASKGIERRYKSDIILGNTYHYICPQTEILEKGFCINS
jgi:queuine/archaeosine tRNA-ribosyltransferase